MNVLRAMLAPDPNMGFVAREIELNLPLLMHAIWNLGPRRVVVRPGPRR